MPKRFPKSAEEILALGRSLVSHLKTIPDTHGQDQWTGANLAALRAFVSDDYELNHFPPSDLSNQKDAFLWDYIAYQQGGGLLIVAESEHDNKGEQGLKHDFEKLFYAIAPIKLFMFRGDRDESEPTDELVVRLRAYMSECCSRFMPGELYILYCRTWQQVTGQSGDRAYFLQVPGEPNSHRDLPADAKFQIS